MVVSVVVYNNSFVTKYPKGVERLCISVKCTIMFPAKWQGSGSGVTCVVCMEIVVCILDASV